MDDAARFLAHLIEALRLVAVNADDQISALPPFVCLADEVALTYGDSFLLVGQIVAAGLLDRSIVPKLAAIDDQMLAMSGEAHAELWAVQALRTCPKWEELRTLACDVLTDLGIELAPPDLGWLTYVGSPPPGSTYTAPAACSPAISSSE